ncbi:hypothetical protein [Microbacterium lacticum]|uniref:Sigma-70-like protein n=1 Tax=Microbacterium lacticum TaxID=33885 RepID=A0A4Y3ULH8_9MICO|nr:hypothetical protein [Microbacterium lacticum]TQM90946.1 hypothetical protein FHX68_2800 [Microbacterium lacticum]GEB95183.1 hypothetical protein MLA01_14020 [Microbacterium lacticum]GGN23151.1 hypothetical protein GCM10009724_16850 [Microbacterium lacticum]
MDEQRYRVTLDGDDRINLRLALRGLLDAQTRGNMNRRGNGSGKRNRSLLRLEIALAVQEMIREEVHESVAAARENGATWEQIAALTGHASRGSAARYFSGIRVSQNET